MRPCRGHPVAPSLDSQGMNGRHRFALAVGVGNVNAVVVAVPSQLHCSCGVIPAKVHAVDARPVRRNSERRYLNQLLGHREDAAATQRWDALGAGLALVRRVAGHDGFFLLLGVVVHIPDRHTYDLTRLGTKVACLRHQKARHHLGHSQQGGERSLSELPTLAIVGTGQPLCVDVLGRLLVKPNAIDRGPLPLLTAFFVGLEGNQALTSLHIATTTPANHRTVQQVGHTHRPGVVLERITRHHA